MSQTAEIKSDGIFSWAKFYRKGIGYFAFTMQRFSGVVIVFYLYLHLFVLSNLLKGSVTYNSLVSSIAYGPYDSFLVLDFLLALVIFYHGANGVRLALNLLGLGLKNHKIMFVVFEVVAMISLGLFLYYAYMLLAGGAI